MNVFDWQFPYASQRMPVLARNIVATSQPLAAQAGLRMLLKGGAHGPAIAGPFSCRPDAASLVDLNNRSMSARCRNAIGVATIA